MNPAQDALYRVHEFQARRRSQAALTYDQFCARLRTASDSDLSGLLPPATLRVEIQTERKPRLTLGRLCITPNAATVVPPEEVFKAVARHATGDWGLLDEHDRQENERALSTRGRLVSVYEVSNGTRYYVITDPGWEVTTLLLPEDY